MKLCRNCNAPIDQPGEICHRCRKNEPATELYDHSSDQTIELSPSTTGLDETLDGTSQHHSGHDEPSHNLTRGTSPQSDRDVDESDGTKPLGFCGEYELLGEIARGGMGVVFKARHRQLNRIAAVKMIRGDELSSPEEIRRFQVEAEAVARLDHPGIVPIFEIGEHQGLPYFAMKYIEGGSLAEHRERIGSDRESMLAFVACVADAVHHAHQRGILHRDIKPANILLDEHGNPLLTDFGLAKSTASDSDLTRDGAVVGTPSYMSPEQAQASGNVTLAADIYSIGAILYELLIGQPPHRADSAMQTVLSVIHEPIQPPKEVDRNVDLDLQLICMKCLERAPDARYSSAADLAADLRHWLSGESISVRSPSLLRLATRWIQRNQSIGYVILAMLAGSLIAFPSVASLLSSIRAEELYAGTARDPVPLIYQLESLPTWLAVASSIFTTLMVPALGLLIVVITRPATLSRAITNGCVVGAICGVLFVASISWYPLLQQSNVATNQELELLASGFWAEDAVTRDQIESQLSEYFPLLDELDDSEKPEYFGNRIASDTLAGGPQVQLAMVAVGFLLGGSIVMGSTIAKLFVDRGNRWWVLIPRYFLGWICIFIVMTLVLAIATGGRFNGRLFSELPLVWQLAIPIVPLVVTTLLFRRWRHKITPPE